MANLEEGTLKKIFELRCSVILQFEFEFQGRQFVFSPLGLDSNPNRLGCAAELQTRRQLSPVTPH